VDSIRVPPIASVVAIKRNHRGAAGVDHFAHSERHERRDGDFFQGKIGELRWRVLAPEAGCAMHVQETTLQRLGKALNVRLDDFTHEPLPSRWVELIHHLNEQERKHLQRQPGPEPRQR
jgi:hypothetical protein